jgi:hypothetical protein
MAQNVAIPGRRVSSGETFYTDWAGRGGDCVLLRVEALIAEGGGKAINFALETRGEDGTTVTTMTPKSPAGGLEITNTGVATCLYVATTAATAGNGAQEQVRVKVSCTSDSGGYYVVRIFPLIFFESARAY